MTFFRKRQEKAWFYTPGADDETSCTVEYRIDPLTGQTSVICETLLQKFAVLYGQTDHEFLSKLVTDSRSNCIFCPPAVYSGTPRYSETLCQDGRLENTTAILFPNLFPTSALHAVLTWPESHYLSPDQFTPDILSDAFDLAARFAGAVRESMPGITFLSLNCNYMPPAGGSIVHPHFQIIGSHEPPYKPLQVIQAAETWYETHRSNYWETLCQMERRENERWIAGRGSWSWLAPWSPVGANEVIGVHAHAPTVFDLTRSDWCELADGLHRILACYNDWDCSSFNIFLAGGRPGNGNAHRCIIRVITRQNVRSGYRNDEYFLQKFHGVELIVRTPELLAAEVRSRFES